MKIIIGLEIVKILLLNLKKKIYIKLLVSVVLLTRYRLKKPLIAAVEGYALGGGTEILQATDIRVAGRSAKFGVTEAVYGLFPLGGSTVRLRRQIPYTIAAELLLTGRHMKEAGGGSIVNIGSIADECFRVAVTFQAPHHLKGIFLPGQRHLVDRSVARLASDSF